MCLCFITVNQPNWPPRKVQKDTLRVLRSKHRRRLSKAEVIRFPNFLTGNALEKPLKDPWDLQNHLWKPPETPLETLTRPPLNPMKRYWNFLCDRLKCILNSMRRSEMPRIPFWSTLNCPWVPYDPLKRHMIVRKTPWDPVKHLEQAKGPLKPLRVFETHEAICNAPKTYWNAN